MAAALAGCGNKATGEAQSAPPLFPIPFPTYQPAASGAGQPTPTLFIPGLLFDPQLDLMAGPVPVPLELEIPSLNVNAPVLGVGLVEGSVGVGLTWGSTMDAPHTLDGKSVWDRAFWYRGSGIPGDSGTATIAGHVNDSLGKPEIFARIDKLHAGDLIIVHSTTSNIDITFSVDQVKNYSLQEATTPEVLTLIYGAGPVTGIGPQPSLDGLSHLTLITCAGEFIDGYFDHHTVVYATRSN